MAGWRALGAGSWLVVRFVLAAGTTALGTALPLVLLALLVGLPLLALGILSTLVLPFGSDPPLAGLFVGILIVVASLAWILISLLLVVVLTLGWSAAVLTPLAIGVHALLAQRKEQALRLECGLITAGGALAGCSSAGFLWIVCALVGEDNPEFPWSLPVAGLLGLVAGGVSAALYALALHGTEALRVHWARRHDVSAT